MKHHSKTGAIVSKTRSVSMSQKFKKPGNKIVLPQQDQPSYVEGAVNNIITQNMLDTSFTVVVPVVSTSYNRTIMSVHGITGTGGSVTISEPLVDNQAHRIVIRNSMLERPFSAGEYAFIHTIIIVKAELGGGSRSLPDSPLYTFAP
jgi:hypothetical protein